MARFIQAWKMYDLIPMKSKSILPDEGFDTRSLVIMEDDRNHSLTEMERTFSVYCLPKPNKGYAKHRVMVICDCGRHVPFGRMGQHWAKPTCTRSYASDTNLHVMPSTLDSHTRDIMQGYYGVCWNTMDDYDSDVSAYREIMRFHRSLARKNGKGHWYLPHHAHLSREAYASEYDAYRAAQEA